MSRISLAVIMVAACLAAPLGWADEVVWKELELEASKRYEQRDYDRALLAADEALRVARSSLGPKDPRVAETHELLADIYLAQANFGKAEESCLGALEIRQQPGSDEAATEKSLDQLAALYMLQSRYAQAEPLYERLLEIRQAHLGSNHPIVAETLVMLANAQIHQKRYPQAKPLQEVAIKHLKAALGPNNPVIANTEVMLAKSYAAESQYPEAESLYRDAVAIREQAHGSAHPIVAQTLRELVDLYVRDGQVGRAVGLQQRLLAIREKSLGPKHAAVSEVLASLAELYTLQGDTERAQEATDRAIKIEQSSMGEGHPYIERTNMKLAHVYEMQGKTEKAEELVPPPKVASKAFKVKEEPPKEDEVLGSQLQHLREMARADREEPPSAEHRNFAMMAEAFNGRGEIYTALGNDAEAEALFRQALVIYDKILGQEAPGLQVVLKNYYSTLRRMGRDAEAREVESRISREEP